MAAEKESTGEVDLESALLPSSSVESLPLLAHSTRSRQHSHLRSLRRSASNTTSQIAIVGSDPCPIESLDYESVLLSRLLLVIFGWFRRLLRGTD